MPTLQVGQSYLASISSNDSSSIVNLVPTVDIPVVSFTFQDPLNIIVTAIAVGRGTITYSCDNALPVTETVNVGSRAFLIVKDSRIGP
jgi:hypothetical protein